MAGQLNIGIAGAGLVGRLVAWQACRAGHRVTVFDPAPDAQPRFDGQGAAAFTAAGMLSPLAELDCASIDVARLGLRSLELWPEILASLPQAPFFSRQGSLLLAHRSDLGAAQRVLSRLENAPADMPRPKALAEACLKQLEPSLHGAAHAWLLPGEGQIDPPSTLAALTAQAAVHGVQWRWGSTVIHTEPGVIRLAGDTHAHTFDWVFDTRGLGARHADPDSTRHQPALRGVRGETIWLHAPNHGLARPVRLLHPRHRVYMVPRPNDTIVVGASEIESEDRGPVSVRSALELMSAAYSVMPALAEARIVRMDRNLRPAHPDNEPSLRQQAGLTSINGLFRHGWLLAPALVERACSGLLEPSANSHRGPVSPFTPEKVSP